MIKKLLKAAKHDGFKRYATNTVWVVAEKLIRMIAVLFVGVWIARYLGPQSFGLLSFAQSLVFLFTAFATLGMDSIVVRELVRNERCSQKLMGTAFVIKLAGAIVVIPAVGFAAHLIGNDYQTNLIVIIVASATVFQAFNVIDFYFQAKVFSKYVSIANLISLGLSSVIKIILILNHAPLVYFAMVGVFDSLVVAIGLVYFFTKRTDSKIASWGFDWVTAKWLLRESWPLMLSVMVVSVYMKIDQVMINSMVSAEAVGQYAAAVKISEVWYFIPMVILSSLFPAIVNAKAISEALYKQRFLYIYTWMVWLGIAIAIPISFLSDSLVRIIFGSQYVEAAAVLVIHIWAGVFVFLGVAFSKFLVTEGLVLKAFYRTGFGALANIILNILLIPQYGIIGAAIATLLSQIVANFLYDLFDTELRKHFYLKLLAFNPYYLIYKV